MTHQFAKSKEPDSMSLFDILNFLTTSFSSNKTVSSFLLPLALTPANPKVRRTEPTVSGVKYDVSSYWYLYTVSPESVNVVSNGPPNN